jgi:hypothetical protein
MTYSLCTQAREGSVEFLEQRPLDERVEALAGPPSSSSATATG